MTTAIELKEQIKVLRVQQREADKAFAKKQKDYNIMSLLVDENKCFLWVYDSKGKFATFEEFIKNKGWQNNTFSNLDYEFMFKQLEFPDEDFFRTFMSWNKDIFAMPFEDRKCCVCMDYYTDKKAPKKFANCSHYCCLTCYKQLRPVSGYKLCVMCRASEKPK